MNQFIVLSFLLLPTLSVACNKPNLPTEVLSKLKELNGYEIFQGKHAYGYNDACFTSRDINADGKSDYAFAVENKLHKDPHGWGISVVIAYSLPEGYALKLHKSAAHLWGDDPQTNVNLSSWDANRVVHTMDGKFTIGSPSIDVDAIEAGGGGIYYWKNGKLQFLDTAH